MTTIEHDKKYTDLQTLYDESERNLNKMIRLYAKIESENQKLQQENNELKKEVFLARRILKEHRIESKSMVTSDYRDNREEIIQAINDCIAG